MMLKKPWFLVTNQENLKNLIASGLLMNQTNLVNKYFDDILSKYPGQVLLFTKPVPKNVLQTVTKEKDYLRPVLLQIDINNIKAKVKALNVSGEVNTVNLPDELTDEHKAISIQTPLATSFVTKIFFQNIDDKNDFIKQTKIVGNVDINQFSLGTNKLLFNSKQELNLENLKSSENTNLNIQHAQAVASIQTILFKLANRDKFACDVYYYAFSHKKEHLDEFDPIVQKLPEFIKNGTINAGAEKQVELYWSIVNSIINYQGDSKDNYTLVLEKLHESEEVLRGENSEKLKELSDDLKEKRGGLQGLAEEQLFKKHTNPFSRALILFFLRDKIKGLVDYSHEKINDDDLILAVILFGAREKWIDLSVGFRHSPELSKLISYNMAKGLLPKDESIVFDSQPDMIEPFYGLLFNKQIDKRLENKRENACLSLARKMKWDCIETTINLPKGVVYPLNVTGAGIGITFDGEPKSIKSTIKPKQFEQYFKNNNIPEEVEEAIRKIA